MYPSPPPARPAPRLLREVRILSPRRCTHPWAHSASPGRRHRRETTVNVSSATGIGSNASASGSGIVNANAKGIGNARENEISANANAKGTATATRANSLLTPRTLPSHGRRSPLRRSLSPSLPNNNSNNNLLHHNSNRAGQVNAPSKVNSTRPSSPCVRRRPRRRRRSRPTLCHLLLRASMHLCTRILCPVSRGNASASGIERGRGTETGSGKGRCTRGASLGLHPRASGITTPIPI
ncbi:hypothetical protein B0H19DRAFT_1116388 [Mycena capillaripes]|nr:hypothetical protein B0H19DRAFT_1116388 [Mycena capillaripes]